MLNLLVKPRGNQCFAPKSIHSENLKKDCPEGSYLISSHKFWYSGELKINMVSSIWPEGFAWKSLELIPPWSKHLGLGRNSCTPMRVHTFPKMKSVITRHIFELRIFWPAPQAGNFEIYNFEIIQMRVDKSSKSMKTPDRPPPAAPM